MPKTLEAYSYMKQLLKTSSHVDAGMITNNLWRF